MLKQDKLNCLKSRMASRLSNTNIGTWNDAYQFVTEQLSILTTIDAQIQYLEEWFERNDKRENN